MPPQMIIFQLYGFVQIGSYSYMKLPSCFSLSINHILQVELVATGPAAEPIVAFYARLLSGMSNILVSMRTQDWSRKLDENLENIKKVRVYLFDQTNHSVLSLVLNLLGICLPCFHSYVKFTWDW